MRRLRVSPPQRVIAFDLNGVLCDADGPAFAICQARWKLTDYDRSRYGGLGQALQEVPQGSRWLKALINDPDFILSLAPDPGAQALWRRLPCAKRVVTGHDDAPETMAATRQWLRRHGFGERVDFTRDKASWVRQVRPLGLVEDAPHRALDAAEAGCRVWLVDRPYNQGISHPHMTRIVLDADTELV